MLDSIPWVRFPSAVVQGCRDCPGAGAGRFQTLQAAAGLDSQIANWAALCVLLGFQSAKPDRQVFYWLIFKPWVSSDSKADWQVSWNPSSLPKTSLWSKLQIQFWLVIVWSGCCHACVENTEQNRCRSPFFCFSKSPEKFCHGCCVTVHCRRHWAACAGSCLTDLFSVLLGIRKSSGKPWICIGFQKESSKERLIISPVCC